MFRPHEAFKSNRTRTENKAEDAPIIAGYLLSECKELMPILRCRPAVTFEDRVARYRIFLLWISKPLISHCSTIQVIHEFILVE